MKEARIKEIKDRLDKAIGDSWVPKKFGRSEISIYKGPVKINGCAMTHGGEICQMIDPDCSDFKLGDIKATAEFIAHARQDIPYLLATLHDTQERHQERLDQINRLLSNNSKMIVREQVLRDALKTTCGAVEDLMAIGSEYGTSGYQVIVNEARKALK